MRSTRSLALLAGLVLLAQARLAPPHELLQSDFTYSAGNSFSNAFFRSFFGWQSVGAFGECMGVVLPWMGSFLVLWTLSIIEFLNNTEDTYDIIDFLSEQFFGSMVATYRQQRCYFLTSVGELSLMSSISVAAWPMIPYLNEGVVYVISVVVVFFLLQLFTLNVVTFFMDIWDLITGTERLSSLGYIVGDVLKYYLTGFELAY